MKIQVLTMTAVLAAAMAVSYCKKADEHQGHMMMDTETSKTVMLGDVQAVFDLMDRVHHEGMMSQMGSKKGAEGFSHYVLLTMMKKAGRKLIMDADVTLSVTGPDGRTVEKKAHVMSGMGMHHYAASFKMEAKGDYRVHAAVRQPVGEMSADTTFTMK